MTIVLKKRRIGMITLLVGLFMLGFVNLADAKGFGKDCETKTWGGGPGECTVSQEVCTSYFLWIKVRTSYGQMNIDC